MEFTLNIYGCDRTSNFFYDLLSKTYMMIPLFSNITLRVSPLIIVEVNRTVCALSFFLKVNRRED